MRRLSIHRPGYGNGGIQYMLAIEHACNSVQNSRICDLIVGITGNFDTPGGNRGATAATFDEEFAMMGSGLPMASADLWDKVLGVEDIPLLKHHGIWPIRRPFGMRATTKGRRTRCTAASASRAM